MYGLNPQNNMNARVAMEPSRELQCSRPHLVHARVRFPVQRAPSAFLAGRGPGALTSHSIRSGGGVLHPGSQIHNSNSKRQSLGFTVGKSRPWRCASRQRAKRKEKNNQKKKTYNSGKECCRQLHNFWILVLIAVSTCNSELHGGIDSLKATKSKPLTQKRHRDILRI